ncbi:MAG: OmpA family protein [Burkholderiales bacterium]
MNLNRSALGLALGLALLAGCAGNPDKNLELENARSAYTSASNDSQVVQHAPLTLDKAREHLLRSEHLFREEAEPQAVTHHAYLSKQYVATARQTTQTKLAEEAIKQATIEHDNLILLGKIQQAQAEAKQAASGREAAEAKAREAELTRQQYEHQLRAAEAARADAQAKAREFEARSKEEEKNQGKYQKPEQARAQAGPAGKKGSPLAELKARETKRGLLVTLGDVLFEGSEAELKPEAAPTLDKLATFLKQHPKRTVLIESFTDDVGSEKYNQYLSEQRGMAVRQQLLARGVESARVAVKGYGEARPIATNDTAAGRQQNRRVEIVISEGESAKPSS